jgi:hypothetical protein
MERVGKGWSTRQIGANDDSQSGAAHSVAPTLKWGVEMSHDRWRDQLHDAGANAERLAALFKSGTPSDGLQLAGSAVLATTPSTELAAVIDNLAGALRERNWIGDTELARALTDHAEQRVSELVQMDVQLDDLADVIDQPPSSESYIDLESRVRLAG